jgi:predicted regulator of Ras-like GTPase activity (Roadblock/LC7/MglB family)
MFLDRLNKISNQIEGTVALSLVGKDGIPVESVSSDPEVDLELLAAEMVTQLRAINDNHRELNAGTVRQFSITTELVTLVVSYITSEYYLLLVLGEGGNYGRARFELRRAQLLLESDLR